MLNKIDGFIQRYDMLRKGDTVICAVSGGADSVALLFALYLLRDKLDVTVKAAHFNHKLRGAESDADEMFVRELCQRYDIELFVGSGEVRSGKKGLEAAARDARYAFLTGLPGKIATAHTANDNAETLLMHLTRGTGLKGLGGIAPVRPPLMRPMLTVTRQEVTDFLEEYHLPHREDSSNASDAFLRNRLRHHVMPLLEAENPRLAENLSAAALRLRQDEECLAEAAFTAYPPEVEQLRAMHSALRSRVLERFLKDSGVKEPEAEHIALAESLVFSQRPSAYAVFPGGVIVRRCYGVLQAQTQLLPMETIAIQCPGQWEIGNLRISCRPAEQILCTSRTMTVRPCGTLVLRPRQTGDAIRLPGGTKSLKKLFIDRKIPAACRDHIPVLADEAGIVGVYGIGVNQSRIPTELPAWQICFEEI